MMYKNREERNEAIANMIRRYLDGDNDAFTELYYETKNDFTRFCQYIFDNLNEYQVDDVVQSAYIKMANSLDRLEEPVKFIGWAHQIIRRCAIDMLRREYKYVYMPESEDDEYYWEELLPDNSVHSRPDDWASSCELRDSISSALSCLSGDIRETFCLYYFDELKVDEIAEAQGIRPGTVKSRLSNAREKLRRELGSLVRID